MELFAFLMTITWLFVLELQVLRLERDLKARHKELLARLDELGPQR